ncbi:Protein OAC-19 [Aphelenchoides avenae]|nr:Protein OAC-19 [Aphelenchus avenae]
MTTFSASKLDKRQDIQGLRAVAIIAVLVYHAWPKRFPSGCLGVDVFFVISGYLMSAILLRQQITRKICNDFYFRRIRRIVPTYLLVFSGVVLFCRILVFYGDIDGVLWELLPALTFTTNLMDIQKDENYFRQTYKYQFFLHTWSLGVEMQFYFFAPLLFSLLQRLRRPTSLLACTLLCVKSFLLQQSVSKEAAFGLVFCRLWQFGVGALAYLLTNANAGRAVRDVVATRDEDAIDKGDGRSPPLRFASYVALFGLTFVLFLPYQPWNAFGQLFAVLFAFILLSVGKYAQPLVLTNAANVKLGDISYTLYLVHWPVFQFWKYWNPYHLLSTESASWLLWLEIGAGIALIVFSIMIAYSVETYVDVPFRRLSTWKDLLNLLVLLYTVAALAGFLLFTGRDETSAMIESQRHELHRFARRLNDANESDIASLLSTETRIRLNVYAGFFDNSVQNCSDHFPYFANFTKGMDIIVWHCRVKGTGKKTAMLIGNSHALTMFEVVAEAFSDEYASFYFLAFPVVFGNRSRERPVPFGVPVPNGTRGPGAERGT